jgi:putative tricarboxylic transport membrane protein
MGKDKFVGLFLTILGLLISIGSIRLGLGNLKKPQSGLFPFLVGIAIVFLSTMLFREGEHKKESPILGVRWKKVLLTLGSLVFYALGLGWLGLSITTFLFMLLVLKAFEPQRWTVALTIAVLTTFFTYLLFSVWLKVEFPVGIFEW